MSYVNYISIKSVWDYISKSYDITLLYLGLRWQATIVMFSMKVLLIFIVFIPKHYCKRVSFVSPTFHWLSVQQHCRNVMDLYDLILHQLFQKSFLNLSLYSSGFSKKPVEYISKWFLFDFFLSNSVTFLPYLAALMTTSITTWTRRGKTVSEFS